MDYSIIRRPKPPAKKPADPPPKPPALAPPLPPPPPPTPPPPYVGITPPPGPYTDEHLDQSYHSQQLRSIEYSNARTWRMNGDNYSDNYGDLYYSHRPVRLNGNQHPQQQMMRHPAYLQQMPSPLGLPQPYYHQGPQRLSLPPTQEYNHHHGSAQRLSLPPPEYQNSFNPQDHHRPGRQQLLAPPPQNYHYEPPPRLGLPPPEPYNGGYYNGPPQVNYYYPPAQPYHGGGYFSDENPNACIIM